MPDHDSEIEATVRMIRANQSHEYEMVDIRGVQTSCCKRCGARYADIANSDPPRKCPGFMR